MNEKQKIQELKELISKFHEEVKSNKVTDLCVWLENLAIRADYEHERYTREMKSQRREK